MPKFAEPAPTFQTERLLLRPLTVDDAPEVQKQFERFEVVRYLSKAVPWPYPPDGAQFFLDQVLSPNVEAGQERAWAITLRGQLIGAINISAEGDENRGFWLAPEYWGQGFMTEASQRVTDYVMGELGWPQLVTGNTVCNEASSKIKKSQGFELISVFPKEFVCGLMDYEQWQLTRRSWLKRRGKR